MKLSKAQQNVIDKMTSGWQLQVAHSIGSRSCWLQQGIFGEGGTSEDVKYSTLDALFRKGLIDQVGRVHGIMTFKLTLVPSALDSFECLTLESRAGVRGVV